MSFSKSIIQFCFFLEEHKGYQRTKAFFRDLLDNPRSPRKRYFDLGMIVLVLSSVSMLVYAVKTPPGKAMRVFEYLAVSIFIAEYLARVWVYSDAHRTIIEYFSQAEFLKVPFRLAPALGAVLQKKWEYVSTPLAVIDLLAILPSYRPVRLLRVFLLFRLFKLFRYSRTVQGMTNILSEKRFEFYTLALFIAFVVFAASSAIYVFEGGMPDSTIDTFFDAVYWSLVTLSTVGYGDIIPHTTEGRVVAVVLILSGIGVLAFTTSIIVSAFQEKLGELREHRVLAELERISGYTVICGYGEVGQVVVDKLYRSRRRLVIIEQDGAKTQLASQRGHLVVQGDAASNDLLRAVGVHDRAHTLLCGTGDDVTNVFVTVSARQMNPGLRIISRANKKEAVRKLTLAGADHVVAPFEIVGLMGAEYVGRPVAFEAVYGMLRGERGVILEAVRVAADSFVRGRCVGDVDFPDQKLLLFGVITRRSAVTLHSGHVFPLEDGYVFYFRPPDTFGLGEGDILVIFGYELSILHFREKMSRHEQ